MDGEQAWVERIPLVLVVDQRPFVYGSNRFCVLQPLLSLEGQRIVRGLESFPNRDRVWWMLGDGINEDLVVPGSLWTGRIERAVQYDEAKPTSDMYQAVNRDIHPAGADLIELLPLPDGEPDLLWVQRATPLPWPKPTTSRVI